MDPTSPDQPRENEGNEEKEKDDDEIATVAEASDSFLNVSAEDDVSCDFGPKASRRRGLARYKQGLKNGIPVRFAKAPPDTIPLETNGFLNYITFGWLSSYMWQVFRKGVYAVRGLRIPKGESSEICAQRMERFWQEEIALKGEKEASFGRSILKSFKTRLIIGSFVSLIYAFLSLANPILVIRHFLTYLTEEEVTVSSGIGYAIALGVILLLRGVTGAFFWMLNYEAAMRIKYGSLALLYKKVMHLKTLKDKTVGDIVNFISNDGQRIWDGIIMGPFIIGGPMILVISCVYSVVFLGPWALVSFLVIFGFYPFAMFFAKKSQSYREDSIKITDKRVGLMNELLTAIKLVKMYAWEISFAKKISDIRSQEKSVLEKSVFVQSISMGSSMLVAIFASVLTFTAYVATGNNLTATEAFTFLALLNTVQASMMTIPFALKALSEVVVTTRRFQEILLMEEMSLNTQQPGDNSSAIEIHNASFTWGSGRRKKEAINDKSTKSQTKSKKKKGKVTEENQKLSENQDTEGNGQIFVGPTLRNVTFTLKKGHLLGVCGNVGSGKSSLISAVLGRMDVSSGSVAVSGPIAYVSQQAWITNDTVRDNIVLGQKYDASRYEQVVQACALTDDFRALPCGDITEVGERGTTLSGGQKQRISLARAVYSQCDLILLDDPLSAVDVHIALHIFQHCILGLMKNRTVVFVTHHIQFLKDCDQILVMKDGSVAEQGSHEQLLVSGKEYANLISLLAKERDGQRGEGDGDKTLLEGRTESRAPDLVPEEKNLNHERLAVVGRPAVVSENGKNAAANGVHNNGRLVREEEMDKGALQYFVVHQYILAMGGFVVFSLVFFCFCLPVAGVTSASWYLSYWLEQGGGNTTITVGNTTLPSMRVIDHPDVDKYLLIYAAFIPILIITSLMRSLALTKGTLRASSSLHDKGFIRVLCCPMTFFYSTPVGRIINRFSADLDEIDVRLPMNVEIFLSNVLQVLAALAMIAYVSPWFLIAAIPLGFLFFFLMIVFHVCIRELKCLDNITRSPVISHMGASVQGLFSIHAYNKTKDFIKKHCELLNANSAAVFLFYSANRWLALRLDFVSAGVAFVTGLLILLTYDHLNPALAGLALSYAVQMSGLFQFTARLAVETEARFTSVQRILEYCNINEKETSLALTSTSDNHQLSEWPKDGSIKFVSVKMRYRNGLPLALNDATFEVKPCEQIGIVGRSGAGKTSLTAALFRLVELESGQILIDGQDISRIALDDLRSKLSIIPQDPVLFSGSLRYNLDPFQQFSDADLWQALEKCHVSDLMKSLEHQLDTVVSENGDNFSVGERQLVCMARALLRNSKILVLDEATAAIDSETDALLQKALRDAFSKCTMLVIAHRLHTVIDCDKILVMEEGMIKEFDTPANLLSNPSSKFKSMLEVLGSRSREPLPIQLNEGSEAS